MRRAALICCLLGGGCTSISSHPAYDQPSPILDGGARSLDEPLHFTVTTDPPPDVQGLATRDAVIRLTFDDYPDPATAVFGSLLLSSGTDNFDVEITVDLLDKSILVRPHSLLQPDTQYEIVLRSNVRSLSGRTVGSAGAKSSPISVGEALNPSPSPTPSPVPWDMVNQIIGGCAPACHSPRGCNDVRKPSRQLDLTGPPDDPMYGLINVESVALLGTGYSMLRVQPGDSANSMLLRKLLGGDPHADSCDPPIDDLAVPGRRMPLNDPGCMEPPPQCGGQTIQGLPLTDDQIRTVQDWIDQGASYP